MKAYFQVSGSETERSLATILLLLVLAIVGMGMVQAGLAQSIGDRVWRDTNQNGLQDADETGIADITVHLLSAADNSVLHTVTTAANGSYSFANLTAGRYIVEFVPGASWFFSPNLLGANRSLDSDPDPNTGRTAIISLANNGIITNVDAGLIPKNVSNLLIRKTIENNTNRFFAGDEFTFLLTVLNQGPNDANNVRVTDQLPAGVTLVSTQRPADSGPNPLIWYETTIASGASVIYRITVRAGSSIGTFENCAFVSSPNRDENLNDNSSCVQFFILERPPVDSNIRIGDRVWLDSNENGIQDGGETGLANVNVQLLSSPGGNLLASTTTNGSGIYEFTNVAPGSYMVSFELLNNYHFTPRDQTADASDSDADQSTGRTIAFAVITNQVALDWDAGMALNDVPPPVDNRIGDLVWQDTNSNGIQESGEPGLANVNVQLLASPSMALVASTTTNASGLYEFNDVTPGAYILAFTLLNGYHFTIPGQDGENLDSDANTTTGRTDAFTIGANETNLNWDAGMAPNDVPTPVDNRIGDLVWQDTNSNGIQDSGEPGLANVNVQLLASPSMALVASTTTNASGLYEFNDVTPGAYILAFTLLNGYHFTIPGQDGENMDSDANTTTGRTDAFTIGANETNLNWDAGMAPNDVPSPVDNRIGDLVWVDSNANGIQESGEPGLANVNVQLLASPSLALLASTTTNASGLYEFNDVTPGTYILAFTLLNGYHFTSAGQDGEALDSDANPATGRTDAFTIGANEINLNWDAGMLPNDVPRPTNIRIGDWVWLDVNKNGLQDANEPGVANVIVHLLSDGTNTLVASTTTNANGFYTFTDVPAGAYTVEFILPANYSFTLLDAGADDVDSDANPTTGRTAVLTVVNDQQTLIWDAGLVEISESDLQVVKSIPNALTYYFRHQEVTFLLRITNHGPDVAHSVRIIDTVPDGLEFVSATPAQSSGPNPLIWEVAQMAVGETMEIMVVMRTTDQLGGMDNCVNVSSLSTDPDLTNNLSCAQIHILVPVELSSFSARALNNQVVLEWITQSETENLGFHLLRANQEEGPYTQITQAMIRGAGTASSVHHYQYQDFEAGESKTYYYKLVDVDYNGHLSLHGPVTVTMEIPTTNLLDQNYPNPFNPSTRIRFVLKEQGQVSLTIFNIKGEKVRELVANRLNAGSHVVEWDGMDQNGRQVPSGMYLYSLRMNDFEQKRMMMLLK